MFGNLPSSALRQYGKADYRFDFFPAFLLLFTDFFDARFLVAPFLFFFATAVAISRLVIGTLSDDSEKRLSWIS
jgi:hypothetical protein